MTLYVAKAGTDPDIQDPEDPGGGGGGGDDGDPADPSISVETEDPRWPLETKPERPTDPDIDYPPGWDRIPAFGAMVARVWSHRYSENKSLNVLHTELDATKMHKLVRKDNIGPLLCIDRAGMDIDPALIEDKSKLCYIAQVIVDPETGQKKTYMYGTPWQANGYSIYLWEEPPVWVRFEDDQGTYRNWWRRVWYYDSGEGDVRFYHQYWMQGQWSNLFGATPPDEYEQWDQISEYRKPITPDGPGQEGEYGAVYQNCIDNGFGEFLIDPAPDPEDLCFRCLTRIGFCVRDPQELEQLIIKYYYRNPSLTGAGELIVPYKFGNAPMTWEGPCGIDPFEPPPAGQYKYLSAWVDFSVYPYPAYNEIDVTPILKDTPAEGPLYVWVMFLYDWEGELYDLPEGHPQFNFEQGWEFSLYAKRKDWGSLREAVLNDGVITPYHALVRVDDPAGVITHKVYTIEP